MRIPAIHSIILAAFAALLAGCGERPSYFAGDTLLAKAGHRELYLQEVVRLMPEGLKGDDSTEFAALYVDRWIKKQLKLQEAEELFSSSADDIDALVEEYRQSLLIRKLDQYYIDSRIDTTFTENEIQRYYNSHLTDFTLNGVLIKGRILRFGDTYRQPRKLMTLMRAVAPGPRKDLADLCAKNGFTLTEYDGWVDFKTFLGNLPVVGARDYTPLLASSDVQQMRDDNSIYYFQITAVRRAGDPQPLEMVRSTIRRILFNRRQSEIIRAREEEMLEKARAERKVRTYDLKEKN